MRETDLTSKLTIKFIVDGAEVAESAYNTLTAAQQKQVASALALANQTEETARRSVSAAAGFQQMASRMDPANRAMADLQRNINTYNNALANNSSITDRAGQGLDVYLGKINAQRTAVEALVRQQEILASQQRAAAGFRGGSYGPNDPNNPGGLIRSIPVRPEDAINKSFGIGQVAPQSSARASASAFFSQADIAAQEAMASAVARLQTELNPLAAEEERVAEKLRVLKGALDATMITQDQYVSAVATENQGLAAFAERLNAASVAAENLRRQQSNLSTNTTAANTSNPTQITGVKLSNVNTSEYAAQFAAAAAAQDAMVVSMARLRAEINPFEAEQGRLGAQMATYKSALDAGLMSQETYRAEQEKAGLALQVYADKLNAASVAAENLRRQQSNLSTNTTVATTANPTQITGAQLSNVNTKEYAAQFEAAAKAQDDQVASITRLRAAINPLEVEQSKLGVEMANYKNLLQQGRITTTEYAQAQEMAGKRLFDFNQNLHQVGAGGRVAANELTNLSYQVNDVVSGLAMGQSPFRILTQQGGQIYQVFQSSKSSIADFGRAGVEWFSSVATASRLAVGGIVAVGAGVVLAASQWQSAQKDVERSVIGIGARTGTTVADINKFASANASATGLSVDQARTAAIEFTKTGDIAVGKLKGLGDAVYGYSILTGTNATDATKTLAQALSGDLVKGAQDLDKTYGFLNPTIEDSIRKFQNHGERAKALQVIIDAMAADNKKAADSVGFLANAWDTLGNTFSKVKNIVGAGIAGSSDEQVAKLKSQPETKTSTDRSVMAFFDSQKSDAGAAAFEKESNRIANAADMAVKAIIPQIKQIEALDAALGALEQQRSRMQSDVAPVPGGALATFDDKGAGQAYANQKQSLTELQAESRRYNDNVARISKSWGDVGQATALALEAAKNNLPVAQAVGGAAKMAAQYTADFSNAMLQGKTATEATALAGANLAAAQAQVNASAQETLFNLKNQLQVSQAITGQQQIAAQYQATRNQLEHDGVNAGLAAQVAAAQRADSEAKATASVQKQVETLRDSTAMIQAGADGTEAATAAAIAYKNAIQSGADAWAASALSAATVANYAAKAAAAEAASINAANQKVLDAEAARIQRSQFEPRTMPTGSHSFVADPNNPVFYRGGGGGTNLDLGVGGAHGILSTQQLKAAADDAKKVQDAIAASRAAGSAPLADILLKGVGGIDNAIGGVMNSGLPDATSTLSTLFQLKNSQTTDKSVQLGNDQQFLSWLQGQPETIANLQAISSLTSEIQSLTTSTNSLNATNQDLLSPYYTQDPRTSHIGFRSQGMATGGEFTVPGGYSANDNVMMQMPLASGEIVNVRRSNDPSPGGKTSSSQSVTINQLFSVNGNANKEEFGRTGYQAAQAAVRQLRMVS